MTRRAMPTRMDRAAVRGYCTKVPGGLGQAARMRDASNAMRIWWWIIRTFAYSIRRRTMSRCSSPPHADGAKGVPGQAHAAPCRARAMSTRMGRLAATRHGTKVPRSAGRGREIGGGLRSLAAGHGKPGREQRHPDLVAYHLDVRVLDAPPNAITGAIGGRGASRIELRDLPGEILHLPRMVAQRALPLGSLLQASHIVPLKLRMSAC
jgi:hypothetical protein